VPERLTASNLRGKVEVWIVASVDDGKKPRLLPIITMNPCGFIVRGFGPRSPRAHPSS